MSTALALVPRDVAEAEQLATKLAQSSLLPPALRGKAADVLVTLMTGAELGLSPLQSIRSIHVVQGRPVMAAELLVALVKRQPQCRYFRLVESTAERATYETLREGAPEPTRMTYSIDDARRANLVSKDNWRNHPGAMLRARCSAALARAEWPDAVLGILETDEGNEVAERQAEPAGVIDVVPEAAPAAAAVAAVREAFPGSVQVIPPEDEAARIKAAELDEATREEDVETLRTLVGQLLGDGDDAKPLRARWYVDHGCGTSKSPLARFTKMTHPLRQLVIKQANEDLDHKQRVGVMAEPAWMTGREPGSDDE